jgi:predicted CXXCH cytochrome family protein
MNKEEFSETLPVGLLFFVLIFFCLAEESFSFSSKDELLSHIADSRTCSNQQCHPRFIEVKKIFEHSPVKNKDCRACHSIESYSSGYDLKIDQGIVCTRCHKNIEKEVQSSKFVHAPLRSGDCSSCHDPHYSEKPFLLKAEYSRLCLSCHNRQGLYAGEFVHKPVEDGNCSFCHDPHASNYKSRLTEVGVNLCLACHEDMMTGMIKDYVHAPLLSSGCTDCHDPHSGKDKLRLKASSNRLCFICHEDKESEITQYKQRHKPAFEGKCVSCHSPHYSEIKYLLADKIDNLCYNCHEKNSIWKKKRFQHGPVAQGNCIACHNPHGSDNAFVLRLSFPHKFYTSYEKGKYNLCFLCHKEALVTEEKTTTVTNFRNGEINLHRLHVYREKGRTCRACHDIHASDQEDHLREEFIFGNANIPLYYFKTKTGGRCIPGCHKERSYDRVNMVDNTE